MEKLDSKTFDVIQDNIEQLKRLFPEVFTENQIMWDRLQQVLGERIETKKERYEFTWNGKTEAIQLAQKQSTGTLRPCKEESVNWDTTQNLYIEGDNLEVLKLLQNSYRNKVKIIYIDPPYNTGKDFVYKDNFKNNIKNYKESLNEQYKTNTEISGRYHTDWLNMMYPRLKVARNLLKEDGVIFISIDDNEQENLKKICNEIYGEDNFIAQVIWERAYSPVNLKKNFSESHDFILVYAKNLSLVETNGLARDESANNRYHNPDQDPRGNWKSSDLSVGPAIEKNIYQITTPSGRKVLPPAGYSWRLSEDRLQEYIDDNRIWFGEDGNNVPSIKRFLSEVKSTVTPMTIWKYKDVGHSQSASQYLKSLFDNKMYFSYPKPVALIKRIIELYEEENSIILDFFSGSATTAEAVLEHNLETNSNNRFILVQLPEPYEEKSEAYKNGYKFITDMAKDRIRRASAKIQREHPEVNSTNNLDTGFKVLKLDETNLKAWDENPENLEDSLFDLTEPIKEGRTQEDVIYEILLKYGVDLTVPIAEKTILNSTVYSIGLGYLFICLDRDLTLEQIEAIAKEKPHRVVFYDDSFKTDVIRTNAQQILKRYDIEDIRVI